MPIAQRRFHGKNLRAGRYSQYGGIYLVTAVTVDRIPIFTNHDCARVCARQLHNLPSQGLAATLAWVVMPDHIHYLFSLHNAELATLMRRFKSCAARSINAVANRSGPVWQRGYHDHALRAEEDVKTVARYVVTNPLRAGLCRRLGDYPYWHAAWL